MGEPNETYAIRVTLVFSSFCFFASANFAQTTASWSLRSSSQRPPPRPEYTCQASFGPPGLLTLPGPAAPYSAVQESSSVQTLADGTHITRKPMTEKIYRDSEGRTRTERAFCLGPGGTPDAMVIEIRDPVSGYSYILDEQNQVAHRFAIQVQHPSDTAVRTGERCPCTGSFERRRVQPAACAANRDHRVPRHPNDGRCSC